MEVKPYRILWVAALTPELAMIPDSNVFTIGKQQRSLTATARDVPGLLLKESDPLLPGLAESSYVRNRTPLDQVERKSSGRRRKSVAM